MFRGDGSSRLGRMKSKADKLGLTNPIEAETLVFPYNMGNNHWVGIEARCNEHKVICYDSFGRMVSCC